MKKTLFLLIVCCLMASVSFAGNIDTFGIGAKATSMGGAFCATADNPFAVYYNPAGLTQIEDTVASAGLQVLYPTIKITNFEVHSITQESLNEKQDPLIKGPKEFSNTANSLLIPSTGFSMPLGNDLYLGFAVYVPWGVELEWEKNPYNNPASFNVNHSYLIREAFNPTIAYKINDRLSIGGGVSLGKSKTGVDKLLYLGSDLAHVERQAGEIANELFHAISVSAKTTINTSTMAAIALKSAGPLSPRMENFKNLFSQLSAAGIENSEQIGKYFSTTYDGMPARDHGTIIKVELMDNYNWTYHLGVLYEASETITLGLTYRHSTKENFSGDIKVQYPDGTKWEANAYMDYEHPKQVQAGLKYQPYDRLTLEMDLVWTNWSVMEKQRTELSKPLMIHILPGTGVLDESVLEFEQERHWGDTIQKRFGLEYVAKDWLLLRLGYFYDPSPVPDSTMDFMWPDGDKKMYSVGFGINGKSLDLKPFSLDLSNTTIDGVLQYGKSESKRMIGGESHNMNHEFDLTKFYHREVALEAGGTIIGCGVTFNYKF